jgi:CDP-glucose 4,6-dehydratase
VGERKGTLEGVVNASPSFWKHRRVFLTGHTGFKGGWLTLWLHQLGATVHGYALDPPTSPSLFEVAALGELVASDTRFDLGDVDQIARALARAEPEVVFHLAAQPLVRDGYRDPIRTYFTNVIGTAHLLEAVRSVPSVRAVVVITTDKVYDNREWIYPYRENDALGGRDPYSASKACAEMVTASYRASFFGAGGHRARVASARAGNVIGGADWATDRLVPDCLRAFEKNESVRLRYPNAVRPWQHVLEPLSAYLLLAERLSGGDVDRFATSWNFGPDADDEAPVLDVATRVATLWGDGARVEVATTDAEPHEAGLLRLDANRARSELGWRPRWRLQEALEQTVRWHRAWRDGADMRRESLQQLDTYQAAGA